MKRPTRFIIAIAILLVPLTLAGCGLSPNKTVANFLDAFKAADSKGMSKYLLGGNASDIEDFDDQDPEVAEVALSIRSKLTYSIHNPAIEGKTATVPVNITSIDMPRLMADLLPQMFSAALAFAFGEDSGESAEELSMRLTMNAINDPNVPMTTTRVNFPLTKERGKWLIVPNDELVVSLPNAITGNLADLFGE